MTWGGNKSPAAGRGLALGFAGAWQGGLHFFFLFYKGKSASCFSFKTELKQKLTALHRTGKMLLATCPEAPVFKLSLLDSFVLCFLLFSLLSKAWCSQAWHRVQCMLPCLMQQSWGAVWDCWGMGVCRAAREKTKAVREQVPHGGELGINNPGGRECSNPETR